MKAGIIESKKYSAVPVVVEPNTFIGGVASTISTAAALASKLNISESDISHFAINGSDIEARIEVSYSIPGIAFKGNADITHYRDEGGKVTSILGQAFYDTDSLILAKFINATSVADQAFAYSNNGVDQITIILPSASLGSSVLDNGVFANGNVRLYAKPELETINGGNPDGDIQHLLDGPWPCEVLYGYNETAPVAITDLSLNVAYATALTINFTAPSLANSLRHYNIYVNGTLHDRIKDSNDFIINLSPSTIYEITVKAVDYYYNEADSSNVLNTSTTSFTDSPFPTTSLLSLYQMDEESGTVIDDVFGTNNGTLVSGTLGVEGVIGRGLKLNGTSNYFTLPNPGGITTKASLNFWIQLDAHIPSTDPKTGIGTINTADLASHYPYTNGNIYLALLTSVRKNVGAGVITDRTKKHMITITSDTSTDEWKFYQNDQLVFTGTVGTLSLNSTLELGRSKYGGTLYYSPAMWDQPNIHNGILTAAEVAALYNSGKGITL